MSHGSPSENSILERILKRMADSTKNLSGRAAHLGIGDDAALFRPKRGRRAVLTCQSRLDVTHVHPTASRARSHGMEVEAPELRRHITLTHRHHTMLNS